MSKSIRTFNFDYSSFIPEWDIERSDTGLTVFNDIKLDFEKDDDYVTFNYEYPIHSVRGRDICESIYNEISNHY
ncbi:unnamed protein product [Hymenolepis diminuta]|uniref:Uncharacterized protein n=1 Tax=Hymenolepis diminuta TaxID=6216 RepID=A0A564Y0M3_HYMDI|nr:unnamed protein product [Hymenolepis diminuta]VUZ40106.1 unnamed protein product [Hymenolepis diminuta]